MGVVSPQKELAVSGLMDEGVSSSCIHVNLGLMDYGHCLELQHQVRTLRQQDMIPDCLLIVEHPSVFTIGRSGGRENLLVDEALLQERQISCIDIERGGDITYHGPGQLVVYPIFMLKGKNYGVADFITDLEDVMLQILHANGIDGERNPQNRGVWVKDSKIGFVGIAVRRGVTSHGLALNVKTDLSYFSMINPCGLTRTSISSMDRMAENDLSVDRIAGQLCKIAERKFNYNAVPLEPHAFKDLLQNVCS